MLRKILALALLMVAGALGAHPQTVDFNQKRVAMADLEGPWRFHTGDDPAWASPAFNDSGWSLLMAGKTWAEQGYRGYQGVAWYRLSVVVPSPAAPMAIFLPQVNDSFQLYANGHLIGRTGEPPPNPKVALSNRNVYRIPADVFTPGKPLVLAIRVWTSPTRGFDQGGLAETPRIGAAHQIFTWRELQSHNVAAILLGDIAEMFANVFTGLAGLGLFLLWRKERGYLWWGISQMLWAVFIILNISAAFRTVPYFATVNLFYVVMALATYFQFEFYVTFLRQRHDWLVWSGIALIGCQFSLNLLRVQSPASDTLAFLAGLAGVLIQVGFVSVLWRGGFANRIDRALLLVPNCLMFSVTAINFICNVFSDRPWSHWLQRLLSRIIIWPFRMGAGDVVGLLEMTAVLVILLRSYARSRKDEERLESELEAARAVQNVLVPVETPTLPGFAVESVYRPASQVGGDFFQIIPVANGGVLVIIGDVSGKGMPAAMTVSLLVGTVRTLAHYTQSPGEILAAMNQRMLLRSSGGFTTCLIMRIDADGAFTAANAGHLAPYLDGKELTLENGLPLGLSADAQYVESRFNLNIASQLTLMTDGVVEARNASGELFGFVRAAAISHETAKEIAQAAQAFGQEDDITALTVTFAGAGAAHA